MKRFNVILLADAPGENVLMCRRMKEPYQGLMNLVGGRAEDGEPPLHAAYRELREETGVTPADAALSLLMRLLYPAHDGTPDMELSVYAGRLRRAVALREEKNPLAWTNLTENFFDMTCYAGEGNIGHMVETLRRYHPHLWDVQPLRFSLRPLQREDLATMAYYGRTTEEALLPMLHQAEAKRHNGRYYEPFGVLMDGCLAGVASLYAHEDGSVSEGVEIYPPFRRLGAASFALSALADAARNQGYRRLTAQVRTDNAASLALHARAGFTAGQPWINRRGRQVVTMTKEWED